MEKENKKVKNSMFVDLFYEDESAEKNDIALYNALHEEPLPEGTKIHKIRIDDVLYMNFKNDISFGAGGKVMVFGEHQSTINENMPLRSLLYIGRAYEKIVPIRDRYKKKRVALPKPEFYTFYNGKEPWVKEKVLKEYGQFIDYVRKYQEEGKEDAYKCAVKQCIQEGILSDYLEKKGSEVMNMLIAEYDYNMDIEVQREEAFEEGEQKGRTEGEWLKLISQVCKKIRKNCTVAETSDMLEESVETIQQIYDTALLFAPDYDAKQIYTKLNINQSV